MSRERRGWVDAFDRVPVGYAPPRADDRTEPEPATIPLARHRRRTRRRRALALLRAVALRVLAAVTGRKARYIRGMPRLIPVAFIAALLVPGSRLSAQQESTTRPRERWQVTLEGERYVWDIGLVRLDGDSLVIRQSDSLASLPVEHITEIRLIQSSTVDLGAGVAGAMSALTGADDEIYDFTQLELAERRRSIQKILANRPAQP
jgi:hypothetical protein